MTDEFTVVEYIQEDGRSPWRTWFENLDAQPAAKVAIQVSRLRAGNTSTVQGIGAIAECRIDWGPGWRIYLGRTASA